MGSLFSKSSTDKITCHRINLTNGNRETISFIINCPRPSTPDIFFDMAYHSFQYGLEDDGSGKPFFYNENYNRSDQICLYISVDDLNSNPDYTRVPITEDTRLYLFPHESGLPHQSIIKSTPEFQVLLKNI